MVKALITGITGFVGSHLAELLLSKGYEVWGIVRWRSTTENIRHISSKLKIIEADLNDSHSFYAAIQKIKPDEIYHLAAQSFVPTSWTAPADTMKTNAIGTINLFEAVRKAGIDPKIHVAGSSEEYGLVLPEETPIKETNPLRPLSPYGVSKIAQDMLSYQYFKSYGLKTVLTRGFNHSGPRRGDVFVCSDFAKQIAGIEQRKKEPVIKVGNLEAKRDFTDVRDMVKGYYLALQEGKPGERYNICSGKAYSMQQVLDILLGLSEAKITVEKDPERVRPSDVPILLGDNSKFKEATGWKPEISFEQTLKDLMAYWREKIISQ
ncbi:GDP-mannose 4,6-dehydratase [Candidatus Woesearchaeota archaeon]|nr:GDP-mannose 4,6-dehydratase [Candidatus Woesearchaeota archaeon]